VSNENTAIRRPDLARIYHQISTAAADPGMSTALRSAGRLDILSSAPAAPSGRAPCIHTRLRSLATKSDEKSGLVSQPLDRSASPIGIIQHGAADPDKIRLPFPNDAISLERFTDTPGNEDRDPHPRLDGCGIRDKIASILACAARSLQPAGYINQVNALLRQPAGCQAGVFQLESPRRFIVCAKPHKHWKFRPDVLPYRSENRQMHSISVLNATAKFICALVGERGKKLREQKTVSGVDFDGIKARGTSTAGCLAE
jgi:hypothetical protein